MKPNQSSLQRILIVFNKEVLDNLRDRRSNTSALMSTLIGPVLLLIMIVIVGRAIFRDQVENKVKVAVIGVENAPTLVQYLQQHEVEILPEPKDPETQVRNGDLTIVLVIPEAYREDFQSGRPATVRIILDSSRQSSISDIERVRGLLKDYTKMMAALRLTARGISPEIIDPLAVEVMDVSTPQTQVLMFLNMMPYFVIMVIFVGGMYVIIDTTAGERERGSLEPLLINPVRRWEFVAGKLLASIPFAILYLIVTLVAFAVCFNVFPLEEYLGFQLSLDVKALVGIFFVSLPMIVLASAAQMIVTAFTRSFKEAQTYVGFLPLIPALPGIGLAFMPVKATIWMMLIPTFGQQLLINQMLRSEPISGLNIAVSSLVTLVAGLALILVAIRIYQRERLIFGSR